MGHWSGADIGYVVCPLCICQQLDIWWLSSKVAQADKVGHAGDGRLTSGVSVATRQLRKQFSLPAHPLELRFIYLYSAAYRCDIGFTAVSALFIRSTTRLLCHSISLFTDLRKKNGNSKQRYRHSFMITDYYFRKHKVWLETTGTCFEIVANVPCNPYNSCKLRCKWASSWHVPSLTAAMVSATLV